jgi:hypothetical protein
MSAVTALSLALFVGFGFVATWLCRIPAGVNA